MSANARSTSVLSGTPCAVSVTKSFSAVNTVAMPPVPGCASEESQIVKAGGSMGPHPMPGAIADIGVEIDKHAGNLEPDLGRNARLDRSKPEYLDRHVPLNGCDLYRNWAET